MRTLVARLERTSSIDAAEQRLKHRIDAHAAERQAELEAAQSRLEAASEQFLARLSQLRGELGALHAELGRELGAERQRLASLVEEWAGAAVAGRAEQVVSDLERRVRELTAAISVELRSEVESLSRKARRQELRLARQERDRRIRAAEDRLAEIAEGLQAEAERTVEDAKAQIREAAEQVVSDSVAAQRSELATDLDGFARQAISKQLQPAVDDAQTRLRVGEAAAEQEARDRIAEAARTAAFRIEAADRAQERELRIRAAAERAERRMERRVRAAEQRLLDLFERAAAIEGSVGALGGGYRGQLGGAQQRVKQAVIESGDPTLLELHARPCSCRYRAREVRARGRPAGPRRGRRPAHRVEVAAARARPRPRARRPSLAQAILAVSQRADLGAGQARVELDAERGERAPRRLAPGARPCRSGARASSSAPSSASPWRSSQITLRSSRNERERGVSGDRWHPARLTGSRGEREPGRPPPRPQRVLAARRRLQDRARWRPAPPSSGCPRSGLTDHGVMNGAVEHYKACRKHGIKPIIGLEAYLVDDRQARRARPRYERNHLTLLAASDDGLLATSSSSARPASSRASRAARRTSTWSCSTATRRA